jgi:hypothetical protein
VSGSFNLEDNMTTLKSVAMVATLLAGGTTLALAQTSPSATGGAAASPATAASPASSKYGTDTVILSAAQRRALWDDLNKQATNQSASGFEAQTGTFVPGGVKIEPIPGKAAANDPQLQPYDYAMVDHYLVIVDPANKVIADVMKK